MRALLGSLLFLALIGGVPIAQAVYERAAGRDVQVFDVVGPLEAGRLRAFEDDLRTASFLHQFLSPWYQWGLARYLGEGNEKAELGRDGWLFFSDDLDLVTGRHGAEHALACIRDAREQLAGWGAQLLIVAVPPKVDDVVEHYSPVTRDLESVRAPVEHAFLAGLEAAGVPYIDVGALLAPDSAQPAYLQTDTHWTPATMERVARDVADRIAAFGLDVPERTWGSVKVRATGAGDLGGMLRVPAGRALVPEETVTFKRSVERASGDPFSPDPNAAVLLLGDSFTRVFSDPKLGFGTSGGLAERIAALAQIDLDVIAIPGGSARAAREALSQRARGARGKQLVIWQISLRELAAPAPDWAPLDLAGSGEPEAQAAAQAAQVVARVAAVSRVPEEFDYEFCLAMHAFEVLEVTQGTLAQDKVWAAVVAFDQGEATQTSSLQVGERVLLSLEPLSDHYDLEQTAWVDQTDMRKPLFFAVRCESVD